MDPVERFVGATRGVVSLLWAFWFSRLTGMEGGMLAYAGQRGLEFGVSGGGGDDVILLDEATAGRSRSESDHAVELIRRPEKVVRLTVRAARELAASSRSGGLRALAALLAQPMPGPVGSLMRTRLRSQRGDDTDRPPALPTTPAPRQDAD